MQNTPWSDGVPGLNQTPIEPGERYVYRFTAYPAGERYLALVRLDEKPMDYSIRVPDGGYLKIVRCLLPAENHEFLAS
jgi:hypothetical protein